MAGTAALGAGARADGRAHASGRALALWLHALAALVAAMVVVGGATRLTESGLSITEWQPLLGAIPPLSEADWQRAFDLYRQIPQYELMNKGMSLGEFKFIYWWEWSHRLLGRVIGIAFALPLAFFWLTGRIGREVGYKLLGILALGALQGFIGWWMVASGLVGRTEVSQYRLAVHLVMACLIFAALVWTARSCRAAPSAASPAALRRTAWFLFALTLLQIALGALVAGLRAGLIYNTWPLMDGALVPSGLFAQHPWWVNFGENVATVQFSHRMAAYALVAAAAWAAWQARTRARGSAAARRAALILAAVLVQAGLGIATLLLQVPIAVALLHQAGAVIVLALIVVQLEALTPRRPAGAALPQR